MAPQAKIKRFGFAEEEPVQTKTQSEQLLDPESDHDAELQPARDAGWSGFEDEEQASDESDGSVDIKVDEEEDAAPKDEEEEELERLIFGDSAGFKAGIKSFALEPSTILHEEQQDEELDDEIDIQNIADQDLFYTDAPPPAHAGTLTASATADSEDEEDKPAWEDSDDERLVVSLASVPRLRKLRETEADDVVNGREYVRRLRKQYQRLYPTPEWAIHASGKAKRKRARASRDDESGEESASDMDVDDDDLSTQPLARLLKDADIMSRTARGSVKRRKLQPGTVDVQRLDDVSKKGPSAITSLSFHPAYPLLLSSGPSSTLSLHHINSDPPNSNPLLTSLHIKRTPLTTTTFHPSSSDSRIFLSARRRYFHIWNLATGTVEKVSRVYGHQHEQRTMEYFSLSPNGKHMALRGSSKKGGGVINVLDASTLQWVTQVRIESRGGVADFTWWGDGNGLCIAGKNGEVTEWSLREGVVGRWTDEGAVGTTIIAVGGKSGRETWIGGDRWVAVGSSSGIVNVYDRRAWLEQLPVSKNNAEHEDTNDGVPRNPKPLRVLDHITTPTSHLAFSPDGQILLMASRWKHNALRLVHLPSATVYKNWPREKTPLGRITSVAWGRPTEEDEKEGCVALLAMGSETGRVRLWEVRG